MSTTRPVQPRLSVNHGSGGTDLLSKFTDFAFNAANTAGKMTKKGVSVAENVVTTGIDAVGLKDKVEAAENMARKIAAKGKSDANKAVNKARRLANRAFEFEDEDEAQASYDYDLLLSAAGAIEKKVSGYGQHTVTFALPVGQCMVWKARVKKIDIGFSIREMREDENGNTTPLVIEPMQRYSADALIKGELTAADRPRTINLVFDNSHSPLQSKTIAYWVLIGENVSLANDQVGAARTREMIAAEEGPPDYTTFTAY
eukprot:gene2937-3204_t